MVLKKSKLLWEPDYRFNLVGIVSQVKEFRLAWSLNQLEYFHFAKEKDIKIEFADSQYILISNFRAVNGYLEYELLRNKLAYSTHPKHQYLLSELAQFDFFLKFDEGNEDLTVDGLISSAKGISVIDYVAKLDLSKIKSKENLLYSRPKND